MDIHCSHTELKDPAALIPHPKNPNTHPETQVKLLAKIIKNQGWRNPIVVSKRSGFIIAGHARLKAAQLLELEEVPIDYQEFENEADEWAHLVADNKLAELAEADQEILAELLQDLKAEGFDTILAGFDEINLAEILEEEQTDQVEVDAEPQIEEAQQLAEKWNVKKGQVWQLGAHRLICGDSTSPDSLASLMKKDKANLLHADPPYGMGKEGDGVLNDNLYRDKLDAFQMEWWRACRKHIEDNAGAYIWGNAPDLWRLWYCGGLADSERLTFRNTIIWDKPPSASPWGSPIGSEKMRSFPHGYEVCLFFMLGEQGFNNNADNYWEGWEPLRSYLAGEAEKMGWTAKDIKEITGVGMFSHWFTKSQWTLIPKNHYETLQKAAEGKAFLKPYGNIHEQYKGTDKSELQSLRDQFYATRSYFDNTHENMTDVWSYSRVTGDERHGHATPKPVEMMRRAIKSACPPSGIVLEPFIGSGSTLMACEQTGRACRGIELQPEYCAVTIQRWADATGGEPKVQ